MIASGVSPELDELRAISTSAKAYLQEIREGKWSAQVFLH